MTKEKTPKEPKAIGPLPVTERLWTKEEARDYLQLPLSTFNLHLANGDIPMLKIGKHIRFVPDALKTWAKQQSA